MEENVKTAEPKRVYVVNLGEQGITSGDVIFKNGVRGERGVLFMPDVPELVAEETAKRLTAKFNDSNMKVYFELADATNALPTKRKVAKRVKK